MEVGFVRSCFGLRFLTIVLSVLTDSTPYAEATSTIIWPDTRGGSQNIEKNSSCFSENGKTGSCISLKECSHRSRDFKSSRPVICGWDGPFDPRICCHPTPSTNRNDESETGGTVSANIREEPQLRGCRQPSDERKSRSGCSRHDLLSCGCIDRPKNESCPARTEPDENLYLIFQVTNGYDVEYPGKFPWMAVLGGHTRTGDTKWFCGGVLLTDRHVLTAAHCVGGPLSIDVVRLGELDLLSDEEGAETADYTVTRIVPHPDFKPPRFYHDLATLTLDRKVEFSEFVRPVCLPSGVPTDVPPSRIHVMGWGKTEAGAENTSNILQYASVTMVPLEECNSSYSRLRIQMARRYPKGITNDLLCAAGSTGQDSCQGDSGGPLIRLDRNIDADDAQYTVMGIVTAGFGCGDQEYPGLYASVEAHLPWILEQLS